MSLEHFFSLYAQLSMAQPEALASLYATTFIVGGPEGSHAFTNNTRFVKWLKQVADFNRQHGMCALAAVSIREATLSSLHRLATVTWGARFQKTGERVIEFEISYLLEQTGEEWRILSSISRSDQNAEMAKAGLL